MKSALKNQLLIWVRAQWWMALGLLALIGLVVLVEIRPADARLAALDRRIARQGEELKIAQTRLAALPAVESETEQLRRRVENFNQRMPLHQDLPQLIGDVTQISRRSSLGQLAWRPEGTIRRSDQFLELPLEFTFHGDFLNVFSFISQVEGLPRLTHLQRLDVQAKDGMDGQVDVQLTMNVYFSE